ncbi:MAG: hypothetical protein LUH11_02845, partial [Candidatus Gastranaerophilales bacterium]|nr:hypothetical protein [Candidatus Gastranaerophilales bacterium]
GRDDILNFLDTDKTTPALSDIHNGSYTAPVIFLHEDKHNLEDRSENEITKLLQSDKKYVNKTVDLIKEYADRAIEAIYFIKDNQYKQKIIELTENLYKAGINE